MHAGLRKQIEDLAAASPTREICGFAVLSPLVNRVTLHPCTNIASDPTHEFEIGPDDWISASRCGHIQWAYHSHPAGPGTFSEADIECAQETAVPHWLYDLPTRSWIEHRPRTYQPPPLEGRSFVFGELDCYSLLRDYYLASRGIHLHDYPRDETSDWPSLGRLVMQHIEDEGFARIPGGSPIQRDDVLIFRTNGSPQHFAIFLGNSTVLHHPLGALSRKDQYGAGWQRRLHCICRYTGKVPSV